MVYFFVLTTRCIQIQQEHLEQRINSLYRKCSFVSFHRKRKKRASPKFYLFRVDKCATLNLECFNLFAYIHQQNGFWSPYLSIYFSLYVIQICYTAYAFLFVVSEQPNQRAFFLVFGAQFFLLLATITYQASSIITTNCRFYRQFAKTLNLLFISQPNV